MRHDSDETRKQKAQISETFSRMGLQFPEWVTEAMGKRDLQDFAAQLREALFRWLSENGNLNCAFEGCGMRMSPYQIGRREGERILDGWVRERQDIPGVPSHPHRVRNEGDIYPGLLPSKRYPTDLRSGSCLPHPPEADPHQPGLG
jgi:hypothetical protein